MMKITFVTGKSGSGKTTKLRELRGDKGEILTVDDWLPLFLRDALRDQQDIVIALPGHLHEVKVEHIKLEIE